MQTRPVENAVASDTLAAQQTYQDQIIGKRLPDWLRQARVEQLRALGDAMRHSLLIRQRLSKVLARIQGLDSFAVATLETALKARFGDEYNLQHWKFTSGHREPVINQQPVGAHLTDVVYGNIPLVEAALRNFSAAECTAGGQPKGNRLTSARQGSIKPPTAIEFARLCRDIDVGGQYQRHLDSVLQPEGADDVLRLLASSQRYTLLVDAYEARLKDVLSESELQLVVGLCKNDALSRLDGDPVVAMQLSLLGCRIEQIVVLKVFDEGLLSTTTKRVLVHIPGDPNGAWSVCKNLRYLANELGRRLRSSAYQRFFSRFVRRRDSQRFFSVVIPAYEDLAIWANIDLKEQVLAYRRPLFEKLAEAHIRQIKDDAAMLAVPVAELDRQVQREHDQRLVAEGWALLNLAGFFVPAIGAGLLAVSAWQLLGEVYHGIEAWRDGDSNEAFDHLLNVAIDLAAIAATAVGVSVASRVWNRSPVVDGLLPARLEDGTTRLWNQDLTTFRSVLPRAQATSDALGIYRSADQCWIEMDSHSYAVVEQAELGQWRLQPRDGHGPRLCHNGAGAWRLWSEQPAEWDDTQRLFRRLGGAFAELDEEQINQALSIHGLSAVELRALHMHAQVPLTEVLDSVKRIKLDQRIRDVVGCLRAGQRVEDITVLQHAQRLPGAAGLSDQHLAELIWDKRRPLFQRLYDSSQNSDSPGVATLRRVFPGLHVRAAEALLHTANPADAQRLLDTGRVPLALAEAARGCALRIRAARVYEAFLIDATQSADFARVAIGMIKHLPGAAMGVRWRLLEGYADGAQLLVIEEGAKAFALIHQHGKFQLLDAQGLAIDEAGELFEVLAAAYDDSQRDAMGVAEPFAHNVRVLLGRQALQRRQEVESLLSRRAFNSWFRPPQRLADGRIGYPLSGRAAAGSSRRDRPQSLFAMLRALYPNFSDAQVIAWLHDVQHSGRQIEAELARLSVEFETLNSTLRRWERLPGNARVRDNRRYFREALVNCWQRRASQVSAISEPSVNYRFTLYGAVVGPLPVLPGHVSFAHVYELALLGMGLQEVPAGFLQAFPNLRLLELSGNQLTRLPPNLAQLAHLRELDLFSNQIALDAGQATTLANCESLEYINLSYNPLGRFFSLSRLGRLRRLHLRHTGIDGLPPALLECPDLLLADLRENQITQLPEDFYQSPVWLRRLIMLADNPLTDQEAQRLQISLLGVDGVLAQGADAQVSGAVRQRWLDATESFMRDELSASWEELENEPGTSDFFALLGRLLETAEFQQNGQALANRVFAMIRAMHEHAGLREALFDQIAQNLTCQDSVALCFSNLELRMLVWRAQFAADNPQDALLHLGRQLWRLDQVDRIAREDIQARRASGSDPDEIEVALAYRLALRDALDLPAQPGDMLFGEIAGLDPQRIAQARARVESTETPALLAQSLVAREFWQEHLLRTERARFDAIDAPFHDRLAVLMAAETVPEGERVAQMDRIRDTRLQAQRALMLELTLALLQPGPVQQFT